MGTVGEQCLALCKPDKPLEGLPQNKEAFLPPLTLFTAWEGNRNSAEVARGEPGFITASPGQVTDTRQAPLLLVPAGNFSTREETP